MLGMKVVKNMNGKVVVLLSAYNGEKYIREQIDSILNQTYENLVLFIRDDGSKDNTGAILKEYENNCRIRIEYGENIGFFASFLWLLNYCEEGDYYAFSDQDDYWFPDKIEVAIKKLPKHERIPTLYCCNSNYCDADMNFLQRSIKKHMGFSLQRSIVNGETGWGYTQVMNNSARALMLGKRAPDYIKTLGHDTWVHILCLCCGEVIYDDDVHVNMRRHGNNTSIQEYHGGTKWKHQIWRINEFFIHNHGKRIYKEIAYFYKVFENDLPEECKKTMLFYLEPGNRLAKAFYKGRYRDSIVDEMLIRVLFLIGKM